LDIDLFSSSGDSPFFGHCPVRATHLKLPAAGGFGAVHGSGEGAEVVGPGLVVDAVGVGDGVVEVESAG
jgi:hypothetical protein